MVVHPKTVLQEILVSNQIRNSKRKSDISARFGGEEFVILLPNTNVNGAKIVAENLRKSVENAHLIYDTNTVSYTISLGVTQVDLSANQNIEEGLKQADKALYEAKATGRNRVCIKN